MSSSKNTSPEQVAFGVPTEDVRLLPDTSSSNAPPQPSELDARAAELDGQAAALVESSIFVGAAAFCSTGLRIGARRMDVRDRGIKKPPVNESTLDDILKGEEVDARFRLGYQEFSSPDRFGVYRRHVQLVADHIGERYCNFTIAKRAFGGYSHGVITDAIRGVMQTEKWSDELVAFAHGLGLHVAGSRGARELVKPLVGTRDELPRFVPGAERRYWESRILGNRDSAGIAYYLGYNSLSSVMLRDYAGRLWGKGRQYDEQAQQVKRIMYAALLLRLPAPRDPKHKKEIRAVREPLYAGIAQGDFAGVEAQLRDLARARPSLFSRIGLIHFGTSSEVQEPTQN